MKCFSVGRLTTVYVPPDQDREGSQSEEENRTVFVAGPSAGSRLDQQDHCRWEGVMRDEMALAQVLTSAQPCSRCTAACVLCVLDGTQGLKAAKGEVRLKSRGAAGWAHPRPPHVGSPAAAPPTSPGWWQNWHCVVAEWHRSGYWTVKATDTLATAVGSCGSRWGNPCKAMQGPARRHSRPVLPC